MVLERYFAVLQRSVKRHGGTVEKFLGDAVLAIFGIPMLREDDALRAVRAAAAIPPAVEALNGELDRLFGVRLQVRIGVSTGAVVAGTAPGDGGQRLAVGDAVNLAARLQGLAGAGEVVLAHAAQRLVQAVVHAERLPATAVKVEVADRHTCGRPPPPAMIRSPSLPAHAASHRLPPWGALPGERPGPGLFRDYRR
jgi:class 3 adenylate cyclase